MKKKLSQPSTHDMVMASFDLLGVRRKALRLAMVLFDSINDTDVLLHVGAELHKSATASERVEIEQALKQLEDIAKEHHVPLHEH